MPRTLTKASRDDYLALVQRFPLRKVRNDAQHAEALKASGRLIGLTRRLTPGARQYLDVLVVLIREYEQANHDAKPPKAKGIDVLKHMMAAHGMTQRQLAEFLGVGESAVSMILSGHRDLTKSHIGSLSKHFRVGITAFFN